MTTIDWYVLRSFVRILGISFLSLTGLFIVIDVFGNLDDFLAYGETEGGVVRVLCEYYGARVPAFFDRTGAILSLTAAVFVVTWLQRSNELTAIMAAGIPKTRVIKPLIAAVVVISVLGAANRELIIPRVRDQLTRNAQDWLGEAPRSVQPRYDNRTNILLSARHSVAKDQKILAPSFRLPRALQHYGKQIAADEAYHHKASPDHPQGYMLVGVSLPENINDLPSAYLQGKAAILTSNDTDWLRPNECFVVSDVTFEQLAAGQSWRQYSSTMELVSGLRNPSLDLSADIPVAVHARILQPLLDMTLVFLGLPLVLTRESRNVFVAAGKCLLMVTLFFVVMLACHALGSNFLLRPALAAWLPLMIFAPLAYARMASLDK